MGGRRRFAAVILLLDSCGTAPATSRRRSAARRRHRCRVFLATILRIEEYIPPAVVSLQINLPAPLTPSSAHYALNKHQDPESRGLNPESRALNSTPLTCSPRRQHMRVCPKQSGRRAKQSRRTDTHEQAKHRKGEKNRQLGQRPCADEWTGGRTECRPILSTLSSTASTSRAVTLVPPSQQRAHWTKGLATRSGE